MDYSLEREKRILSRLSNEEIWKYLYRNNKGVKTLSQVEPPPESLGVTHDFWNAYAYGNEIKVVYFKVGMVNQKPRKKHAIAPQKEVGEEAEKKRFSASISRSKSRVFELAMCNEFQHFCTFTQNDDLRDRFDITKFRKDFSMFVRNQNRGREIPIKYLLIPEQHANGAWHMHGLLQGLTDSDLREFTLKEKLPYKIINQLKNGKKIYNWDKYQSRFGYFTASEIESGNACARYITKYITKDLQRGVRESGQHLYFASQGLKGREAVVKHSFDECPIVDGWDFENDYVKIKTLKLS